MAPRLLEAIRPHDRSDVLGRLEVVNIGLETATVKSEGGVTARSSRLNAVALYTATTSLVVGSIKTTPTEKVGFANARGS